MPSVPADVRDAIQAWRVLALALERVDPAAPDQKQVERLALEIPVRGATAQIRLQPRPHVLVQVGGVELVGPPAKGQQTPMRVLRRYVPMVLQAAEHPPLYISEWRAFLRTLAEGMTQAGAYLSSPALAPRSLGRLPEIAEASGLGDLAVWLTRSSAELGPLVHEQPHYVVQHYTGWRTDATPTENLSRLDTGDIAAQRLADLWHAVPANPDTMWIVQRHHAPIISIRLGEDGLVAVADADRSLLRAAADAGSDVRLLIYYVGGTERAGRLLQPETGRWHPLPVGRRVALRETGEPGRVVESAPDSPTYPLTRAIVELDTGRTVAVGFGDVRFLAEPLQVRRRQRSNPRQTRALLHLTAARAGLPGLARWLQHNSAELVVAKLPGEVRAAPQKGGLALRNPAGSGRLQQRAQSVLLSGATADAHGAVGQVEAIDAYPPPPRGAWERVAGVPGRWGAYRDQGQADRVYLVANPSPAHLVALRPVDVPNAVEQPVEPDPLYDAEGRKYGAYYQVIEAAVDGTTLVPSHMPGDIGQWSPGYPKAFQARDLGGVSERIKIEEIARSIDPDRLLGKNLDATLGPPVAWPGPDGRLHVLAGNGRVLALLLAPDRVYRAYEKRGRAVWPCWPDKEARPGYRWIMVRVVQDVTLPQAERLAAASQASTSGEETRLGRALSLVRSLGLQLDHMPPVSWHEPLASDNVGEFAKSNRAFVDHILNQIDSARRHLYWSDSDRLAPLMESVMIGFLPPEVMRPGVFSDPKVEDALLGALPGLVSLRSQIQSQLVYPQFDLLTALPEAMRVFQHLRRRRLTFNQLADQLAQEGRTIGLAGAERLIDTSDLGLALAAALHSAARRAAPAVVMSGVIRDYSAEAHRYDPRQSTLFGGPNIPEPATVLAGLVPGFQLPSRIRRNPAPGLDRMRVRVLEFDASTFKDPSSAREWAKAHRFSARAAPVQAGPVIRIAQPPAGPPRGHERRVPLAPGVVAVVD